MCNLPSFTFAGISWPAHIAEFHRSQYNVRTLANGRVVQARMRFAYYHAPKPMTGPGDHGKGFYLGSDGAPGLRWQWADEAYTRIGHTGWYCDDFGDGDKIRGVVFRLPHGRGFLAGHGMGEGMSASLDYQVYADEADAAHAADELARIAAENERDHQASQAESDDDNEGEAERDEA